MIRSLWERIALDFMIAALLVWTLTGGIPAFGASISQADARVPANSSVNAYQPNTGIQMVQMVSRPLTAPPVTTTGNGLGEPSFYTFAQTRCICSVKVNVANGNLVVHMTDLKIKGTGLDLGLTKFYNSLAGATRNVGQNWVLGTGTDIRLQINQDGSVTYNAADAYAALFTTKTGGYTDAAGLNATLTKVGYSYTLTFHKSGEKFNFDQSGRLTSDVDKNGNTITINYPGACPCGPGGASGIVSLTDTQERTTTFGYTTSGYINLITDPIGRTVKYGYDASNRLTTSTDLNGKTTTFGYTGSDLTSIKDPLNNLPTIAYDGNHRVTSITDTDTSLTKFTYNSGNTVVTDANNHTTTYTYDSQERVTQAVDALNHSHAATYTPNDDVLQTTDALSKQTNFTFDVNNNVTSATDASGDKTSFGYTDTNHPYYANSQTDSQGNMVSYTYDSAGNLTTSQDGLSSQNTVTNSYNTNGTIATAKNADGNTTTYGYDSHGNLTTVTPPSPLGVEKLTYDGASRVITFTDGKNQKTTYTYDNLDRITKITYADNSTITYTFDNDSNVTKVVDNTGTTTFTFDGVNQQLTKTLPNGEQFRYGFDAIGNLNSLKRATCGTCNPSESLTYTYNQVNLLATAKDNDGTTTTYSYDNNNRRTGVAYPNGVTMTITYDDAGHETGIVGKQSGGTVLTSYTYSYVNPATSKGTNLRYSVTNTSNTVTTYSYDALNRITKEDIGGNTTTYAYDGAGNLTQKNICCTPGGSIGFTYNAANELTQVVEGGRTGPITYTYDADGNETGYNQNAASWTLTYNAKNQTTSITNFLQPTQNFTYTGPDQTQRVTSINTSGSTNYDYSALGMYNDGTTRYFRDNDGQLISEDTTGGKYFYIFDGMGSVVGLTDNTGTLISTYTYSAYGGYGAPTGSVTNPWRYAGGYYDTSTSYTKLGTRYIQSGAAQWTQQDPIGGSLFDPGSGNRYAYANDNPTNLIDPTGAVSTACILGSVGLGVDLALAFGIGFGIVPGAFAFFGAAIGVAAAVSSVTSGGSLLATGGFTLASVGAAGLSLLPGVAGAVATGFGLGLDVFSILNSCGS